MQCSELQSYFKKRFVELFHKDTIDSYRVRDHYAISLLKEYRDLLNGWKEKRIKRIDPIYYCSQEIISVVSIDDCLDFTNISKQLFLAEIKISESCKDLQLAIIDRQLFAINVCLSNNNETHYLNTVLSKIRGILFSQISLEESRFVPEIERLDGYMKSLACVLVHIGYSKAYLFKQAKQIDESADFEKAWNEMFISFSNPQVQDYDLVFRLGVSPKLSDICPSVFAKEVDSRFMNCSTIHNYGKYLKSGDYVRYYNYKCNAYDPVSAIKRGKVELSSILDSLCIGMNTSNIKIPNDALVITNDENSYVIQGEKTDFLQDGNYSENVDYTIKLRDNMFFIKGSEQVANDVKSRLESALRHLRIGNNSGEIEQKFINYWIALEFIFSSPIKSDNTYLRLKNNLVNILSACYIKRNLLSLNSLLQKEGEIQKGTFFWDVENVDLLINRVGNNNFKYKLKIIKSLLFSDNCDERMKKYRKKHEMNLIWQIERIYRLRNELIHEAAIKQDIENTTSHLRYYLVFLLNQMIWFFANYSGKEIISMDDFFLSYDFMNKKMNETPTLDNFLSISVEMNFLR